MEDVMKKIGIGYENYKEFIDENCYYVDKTMLIEDIIRKCVSAGKTASWQHRVNLRRRS